MYLLTQNNMSYTGYPIFKKKYSNDSNGSTGSTSSFSSKIEYSTNLFSSFLKVLTFYFSLTYLSSYFESKKDKIKKIYEKNSFKYEGFYLFLEALYYIKKNEIYQFKKKLKYLEDIFHEKSDKPSKRALICFILNNLILNNIIKLSKKLEIKQNEDKNLKKICCNDDILFLGSGKTEEESINKFKARIESRYEDINKFSDFFLNKVISYNSSTKEYGIIGKYYFCIEDLSSYKNKNYTEFYLIKNNTKIYSCAKNLILYIPMPNTFTEAKYEKEIKLRLYDGRIENFLLDSIIYEDRDINAYKIMKKNSDNEAWKMFDNLHVKEKCYLDESIFEKNGFIIMLIYIKN